jgi:hypothetical protein
VSWRAGKLVSWGAGGQFLVSFPNYIFVWFLPVKIFAIRFFFNFYDRVLKIFIILRNNSDQHFVDPCGLVLFVRL